MKLSCRFQLSWPVICCAASTFAAGQNPCHEHATQAGWKIFLDREHGFCFEYPPQYKIAPARLALGVADENGKKLLGILATKPDSANLPSADDEDNAIIYISLYSTPFQLDALRKHAPTGLDDTPPERIRAAHSEFYYYGPGGGGVDYSDSYYTDSQGQTLLIDFSGPYASGRPVAATKDIEPKVLDSFQPFRPSAAPR